MLLFRYSKSDENYILVILYVKFSINYSPAIVVVGHLQIPAVDAVVQKSPFDVKHWFVLEQDPM